MDSVTEILEFAAENADYWSEFLSGADYSSVLSVDEMKGLEAARLHVEEGIYDLLFAAGAKLESKLKAKGVVSRNFQRGATIKNRKVRIDPPQNFKDRLYGFEFAFLPSEEGRQIQLYGSLVVLKRAKDTFEAAIPKACADLRVEGHYILAPGVRLVRGETFDALAEKAAKPVADLFLEVS